MLFPSGALLGEKPGPVDMQRLAWTIDPAKRLKMDPLAPQVPRRGVRWRVAGKRQFGYVIWLNRAGAERHPVASTAGTGGRSGNCRTSPWHAPRLPTFSAAVGTNHSAEERDGRDAGAGRWRPAPAFHARETSGLHATLAVCIPRGRCAKIPSTMLDKGQKVVPCSKTST